MGVLKNEGIKLKLYLNHKYRIENMTWASRLELYILGRNQYSLPGNFGSLLDTNLVEGDNKIACQVGLSLCDTDATKSLSF